MLLMCVGLSRVNVLTASSTIFTQVFIVVLTFIAPVHELHIINLLGIN